MDIESPCFCQRCGWLGKLRDAHELQTDPPKNICPRCTVETPVQALGQKGLDGLRREYELLPKLTYHEELTREQKAERRALLERFFKHIEQPL